MNQQMPGRSFDGPLPPLTAEEADLARALRRHVDVLAGDIGERNVWRPGTMDQAADYIDGQLASAGYRVDVQTYDVRHESVKNLVAELRATGDPASAEELLVVGAHYDAVHGCPAANDNGTGVAAVLETARLMAKDRVRRPVRFVLFANEEPPFFQTELMGSLVYARGCRGRGERIVGMMSLETIGCYADDPGSQNYPFPFSSMFPDVGNFIAFVGDERSAPFVREVVGSFRRHTAFPSEAVAAPASVEGIGWSDHWSFWQAGYPALMVTDTAPFRYPHYHHPTDTPDKIDYDRTARVVMGLLRVTRELAGCEE